MEKKCLFTRQWPLNKCSVVVAFREGQHFRMAGRGRTVISCILFKLDPLECRRRYQRCPHHDYKPHSRRFCVAGICPQKMALEVGPNAGDDTIPRNPVIFSDDDWGVQSPPHHSICVPLPFSVSVIGCLGHKNKIMTAMNDWDASPMI